jgi:hypothetical protein
MVDGMLWILNCMFLVVEATEDCILFPMLHGWKINRALGENLGENLF